MSALQAPKVVSPLIRFSRYTLLFSGIWYGNHRYKSIAHQEIEIQKRENAIKERRAVTLAAEQAVRDKAELVALGEEIGLSKA